jgi:hypothetical protein
MARAGSRRFCGIAGRVTICRRPNRTWGCGRDQLAGNLVPAAGAAHRDRARRHSSSKEFQGPLTQRTRRLLTVPLWPLGSPRRMHARGLGPGPRRSALATRVLVSEMRVQESRQAPDRVSSIDNSPNSVLVSEGKTFV